MKKKFLITVLSLVCVFTCAAGLSACGGNGHKHDWSQAWENDETHLWHNCTASGCGITDNSQKDGYAEHDTSNGDCICGYKPSPTAVLQFQLNPIDSESYIVERLTDENATTVIIPSEYEGKPVTEIGANTFSGCNNLASVTIPDSITTIGDGAFYGCNSITSINIPDSVTEIYSGAFTGCSNLTSINIPNGVTEIDMSVFYGCSSLTSITIPNGVTSIGNSAFSDCSSLKSVNIPSGVKVINSFTFSNCSSLISITIPDGVTSIGNGAFQGCSGLTSISIPDGVERLYPTAFKDCNGIKSITVPDSVTYFGTDVFSGCFFETATIPVSALMSIYEKSSLKTVVLTSGTAINDATFKDCANLTNITIPTSVTRIGDEAFLNCENLTRITYNGTKAQWNLIQVGSLWSYNTGDFIVKCTDEEIAY